MTGYEVVNVSVTLYVDTTVAVAVEYKVDELMTVYGYDSVIVKLVVVIYCMMLSLGLHCR